VEGADPIRGAGRTRGAVLQAGCVVGSLERAIGSGSGSRPNADEQVENIGRPPKHDVPVRGKIDGLLPADERGERGGGRRESNRPAAVPIRDAVSYGGEALMGDGAALIPHAASHRNGSEVAVSGGREGIRAIAHLGGVRLQEIDKPYAISPLNAAVRHAGAGRDGDKDIVVAVCSLRRTRNDRRWPESPNRAEFDIWNPAVRNQEIVDGVRYLRESAGRDGVPASRLECLRIAGL